MIPTLGTRLGGAQLCFPDVYFSACVNVALGKPAKQSRTIDILGPHKVADGNRDNRNTKQSCQHTAHGDYSPFWQVVLQATYVIDSVLIVSRESMFRKNSSGNCQFY